MKRRLFHLIAAGSLVLLFITIEQWITSPTQGQIWHFTSDSGIQKNFDLNLSRGFSFAVNENHWTRWTMRQITVPYAAFAVVFAVVPIFWLMWIRQPIRVGHCQICGYDLRATPERCPECGATKSPKPV